MKSSIPVETDLVLIGGGHSHAIAIKNFAMNPIPGVRLTLITDVYHTPYSGMLPGYVAGLYTFDQCHIDLRPLAKFAGARIFVDRAIGLDLEKNQVICANRPSVAFDVLSIDIGSTPASLTVPGAREYTIPVKPISKFLTYWHEITTTVAQSPEQKIRIGIVGGGVGGVELAFAVQSHLHHIYQDARQPTNNLELHLFHRGTRLLPGRHRWVGKQVEKILKSRGVVLHLEENVIGVKVKDGQDSEQDSEQDSDFATDARMNERKIQDKDGQDSEQDSDFATDGQDSDFATNARMNERKIQDKDGQDSEQDSDFATDARMNERKIQDKDGQDSEQDSDFATDARMNERKIQDKDGQDSEQDSDFATDARMNERKIQDKDGQDSEQDSDFATDARMNDEKIPDFAPKIIECNSGLQIECDILFWVTQASAAPWLQTAGLATDASGFILVNDKLQSISHPQVFAAGDVATMVNHSRPKAGVFAVRQGKPLLENLQRALQRKPLKSFIPQKKFLILIGTGDQRAIASRGKMGFGPESLLWRWKDNIDRKFMDKFTNLKMEGRSYPSSWKGKSRKRKDSQIMHCAGCGAKVGSKVLEKVLHRIQQQIQRDDILIGISTPDDAAVVRVPTDKVMVQTIDYFPALVDDPYLLGKITTNHCLSDLFAMGATPQSALAIATIPYASSIKQEDDLYQLLLGATEILNQAGAVLMGGHTTEGAELAFGLTCNGLAFSEKLLYNSGMQSGDVLILTKPLGTGVLFAADMRLRAKGRWIESAIESMLVSNQNAAKLLLEYGATACTDVTGFGLVGHLLEMVKASQVAVELEMEAISVLPGVAEILQQGIFSSLYPENLRMSASIQNSEQVSTHVLYPLLFDPQTSGGLLATVPGESASACLQALQQEYSESRIIGRVVMLDTGVLPIKIC
ncbi:selenide, water dikinase SelD [Okeania sp. SIO3B5]|uniref:selenide, water dikinase SelD n=1 Tax=Okeania sp. SIO3B5 TaxID=2607811 RepID=UPI0025FB3625|nr:selenide, water dikinase SelD [Okeania sp. SIO3B5]